jgi:hypothetical protein
MSNNFRPAISKAALEAAKANDDKTVLWDVLIQPLHEELYKTGTFDFFEDISDMQQLMLSYDYIEMQVWQGGFIQFIQNGYITLLPPMVGWLNDLGATDMAQVLDDVLKVYVLNRDILDKTTTVEEFALLYDELKEFEAIDERYAKCDAPTQELMLNYAITHLEEFAAIE